MQNLKVLYIWSQYFIYWLGVLYLSFCQGFPFLVSVIHNFYLPFVRQYFCTIIYLLHRFARYGRKLGHKMIRVFSASWIELNIATRVFHNMNGSMAQALWALVDLVCLFLDCLIYHENTFDVIYTWDTLLHVKVRNYAFFLLFKLLVLVVSCFIVLIGL